VESRGRFVSESSCNTYDRISVRVCVLNDKVSESNNKVEFLQIIK